MVTRLLQDVPTWFRRWFAAGNARSARKRTRTRAFASPRTRWLGSLSSFDFGALKERLSFVAMAGLPIVLVSGIVLFAYSHRTPYDKVALEGAQRKATADRRRATDLRCLAENIYFESRGEPLEGQYAVAEVTLNRSRSKYFEHSICGVVHEAHYDPIRKRAVAHFSWTELGPISPQDAVAWKQAMAVASNAYDHMHEHVVPGALFYHATGILPSWAKTKTTVATIGNHVFYR